MAKKQKLLELNGQMQGLITDLLKESPVQVATSSGAGGTSLIDRGKKIQLLQKQKNRSCGSADTPVTVCLMKKKKAGSYGKTGMPIEFSINKYASYQEVVEAASAVLSVPTGSVKWSLFTPGGALIREEPSWSLIDYMRKVHKGIVKLGIGDVEESLTETTSSRNKSKYEITRKGKEKRGVPSIISSGYNSESSFEAVTVKNDIIISSGEEVTPPPKRIAIQAPPKDLRASRNPPIQPVANQIMEFFAKELAEGTRNYCRNSIVGRGGYGTVYKGTVRYCTVAIKVLSPEGKMAFLKDKPNEGVFQAEVSVMNRFRHPNILQLFGYCSKPTALVFEYMSNGSLYDKLHKESGVALTWPKRNSIVTDTCRGLAYLHTATPPTIHQDIKAANILLDQAYNAKLGDFGFSVELPRISAGKTMFTSQFMVHSEGYFPPEIMLGKYSDRSDVFSFGVVVLEVWTGMRAHDTMRKDPTLVEYLQDDLKTKESFQKVFDQIVLRPRLLEEISERYYDVVSRCLMKHSSRLTAVEVLNLLQ